MIYSFKFSLFLLKIVFFIENWDMTNVENIFEMFEDCYSLSNASCINWNFNNLKQEIIYFVRNYAIVNPNFKNIATLKDKAKKDINEMVMLKAEYKLNEVMVCLI